MEQRPSLVTLGVADIDRARKFYERLGRRGQEVEVTVFFQAGSNAVVLWRRKKLAQDSGVDDACTEGFGGIALAHNVRSPTEVPQHPHRRRQRGSQGHPGPGRELQRRVRRMLHRSRRTRVGNRIQPGIALGHHHPGLRHGD